MNQYLTFEEINNKIATHLIQQRYQSAKDGMCRYLDSDTGRMCAVGCLIKPEAYTKELEGEISNAPIVKEALEKSGINSKDYALMAILDKWQLFHDDKEEFTKDAVEKYKEEMVAEYKLLSE